MTQKTLAGDPQKILLSHRYFWPDTSPYATILRSIAKKLAAQGHDVTVFTTMPSYHASEGMTAPKRESVDGFNIVRMPIFKENKKNLPLRGFNVLSYAAGLRRHILKVGDYDLVMAATFPPLAAARVACSAAQKIGAKFIYHFMDIHPEVSLYSGQLKEGRLFRALQNFDSKTCRRADALVVLSQDMADSLKARPGNENLQPIILNNFLLENFDKAEIEDAPKLPEDKFTILFAGNIGNYQNLDMMIEAAHQLTDLPDIQFWFMGEGVAKTRLIKQAGSLLDNTVFFLPFGHHSTAQNLMGQANLNLISLIPKIYRVAYPSKTLSILSQNGPVLATVESQSALAGMITEHEIGYVADQTQTQTIVEAIKKAYQERDRRSELQNNIRQLYEAEFTQSIMLERWTQLVDNLENPKS